MATSGLDWLEWNCCPEAQWPAALNLHLQTTVRNHTVLQLFSLLWTLYVIDSIWRIKVSSSLSLIEGNQTWDRTKEVDRRFKIWGRRVTSYLNWELKNSFPICAVPHNFRCRATKHPLIEHWCQIFLLPLPIARGVLKSQPPPLEAADVGVAAQ